MARYAERVTLKRREHNDGYWALLEVTEFPEGRPGTYQVALTLGQVVGLLGDIQAIPLSDQERRAVGLLLAGAEQTAAAT